MFPYSSLVFGTIAFKLYDLGQMFWVSFHKCLKGVCWVFGPFLLTELVCSQSRTGLCDGHSKTLTLLSVSHIVINLGVCLGSLSIWKTHLRPGMLLQYVCKMFFPHDAVDFVTFTCPYFSKHPKT